MSREKAREMCERLVHPELGSFSFDMALVAQEFLALEKEHTELLERYELVWRDRNNLDDANIRLNEEIAELRKAIGEAREIFMRFDRIPSTENLIATAAEDAKQIESWLSRHANGDK